MNKWSSDFTFPCRGIITEQARWDFTIPPGVVKFSWFGCLFRWLERNIQQACSPFQPFVSPPALVTTRGGFSDTMGLRSVEFQNCTEQKLPPICPICQFSIFQTYHTICHNIVCINLIQLIEPNLKIVVLKRNGAGLYNPRLSFKDEDISLLQKAIL